MENAPHLGPEDQAVLADLAQLSTFGATTAGGVDREAGTEAHRRARRWLAGWLEQRGFRVVPDRAGNIFGLLEWTPGAPYVLTGSHLDSQPRGGRLDGAYGVLAAAHAADRVRRGVTDSGQAPPPYNLAVVDWFNEEGSRFKPSMMGSAAYTGVMPLERALSTTDHHGVSVAETLAGTEFHGTEAGPEAAFAAEIHIEQGRILEREGTTIGIVASTWAARKYEISVRGDQAHTGSTVMEDRQDALLGAARIIVAVRAVADRFPGRLHSSSGQIFVQPNSPNVVARQADLYLDLRSADEDVLREADALLDEELALIETEVKVSIHKTDSQEWPAQPYQSEGVELARQVADDLGLSCRPMRTLAGHDSTHLKEIVPTVMLFVPSVEGISHNEREATQDEDLCAGVRMLTEVLERLCRGELEPQSSQG